MFPTSFAPWHNSQKQSGELNPARSVCLSTFQNLLCAPVLSAVVFFVLSHFHTVPSAALTILKCCFCSKCLKRENERNEASENRSTISVNAGALHLLLEAAVHAKKAPGIAQTSHSTTLRVTYSCVYVCVHIHVGILHLIRAYIAAQLSGIMSKFSKNRPNQRREVISLNQQPALHGLKHHLSICTSCSGLRIMHTSTLSCFFYKSSTCHWALQLPNNWWFLLLWCLRFRKSKRS